MPGNHITRHHEKFRTKSHQNPFRLVPQWVNPYCSSHENWSFLIVYGELKHNRITRDNSRIDLKITFSFSQSILCKPKTIDEIDSTFLFDLNLWVELTKERWRFLLLIFEKMKCSSFLDDVLMDVVNFTSHENKLSMRSVDFLSFFRDMTLIMEDESSTYVSIHLPSEKEY